MLMTEITGGPWNARIERNPERVEYRLKDFEVQPASELSVVARVVAALNFIGGWFKFNTSGSFTECFLEAQLLESTGIEPDKNKEQQCERPQRRSAVAEKGQWNPNNRRQPNGHANVNGKVEEYDAGHAIPINPAESRAVSLGKENDAHKQGHE